MQHNDVANCIVVIYGVNIPKRKEACLPRVSVTISEDMADFLEKEAAAQKRSVSSQVAMILETRQDFHGWLAIRDRSRTGEEIREIMK